MTQRLPKIVQSEHLAPTAADWLRERALLVQVSHDQAEFTRSLADADALIVRTYTQVDSRLLELAPRLRVVGRAGAGIDNIDVAACRHRNVEVVYAPDANTQAVVEYVIALACDALRPRLTLANALDQNEWNCLRSELLGKRELSELTLGILGLGRIGKRLAQVAHPLFQKILFNDLVEIAPAARHGTEQVSAEELFARSDVLTVHIDGRASNRAFIDNHLLSHMKDDTILINTSRGFVVDNLSLASALELRPHALALLDVHDPEPFPCDYPLLGLPNVRLYPHLASRTGRAMESMSWVVRDVMAVLEGRKPIYPAPTQ